jgi:hypothetical protein
MHMQRAPGVRLWCDPGSWCRQHKERLTDRIGGDDDTIRTTDDKNHDTNDKAEWQQTTNRELLVRPEQSAGGGHSARWACGCGLTLGPGATTMKIKCEDRRERRQRRQGEVNTTKMKSIAPLPRSLTPRDAPDLHLPVTGPGGRSTSAVHGTQCRAHGGRPCSPRERPSIHPKVVKAGMRRGGPAAAYEQTRTDSTASQQGSSQCMHHSVGSTAACGHSLWSVRQGTGL